MKKLNYLVLIFAAVATVTCSSGKGNQEGTSKVTFIENNAVKKIVVLIDGQLFTTFQWPENVTKPVFYPILTSEGTEITRGFPLKPKAGERADHPHQIGMWLTYGNVNGLDFWGNGSKGLGTRNQNGGVIKHLKTEKITEGTGEGFFITTESWVDTSGVVLLKEVTEFHFIAKENIRIIDRKTILTAGQKVVNMPDTKEGMFGIRVARQLELPVGGNVVLYNEDGTTSRIKDTLNIGITGNYSSSEGIGGEEVWGTSARWMHLFGNIEDEKISLVICDHPENPNYPTYWHARTYGLFAANPLGVKDFTNDKDSLNFSISPGQSATFRYRVIIATGEHLPAEEIDKLANDFALKFKSN
ncbi:PmoA family protein [Mariniphaga sp.]|uniref:DUF6807 domain-containing protein n=1 Tax=Mariniphaga sp. TaxID=1954475 RepID=UPI00356143ED